MDYQPNNQSGDPQNTGTPYHNTDGSDRGDLQGNAPAENGNPYGTTPADHGTPYGNMSADHGTPYGNMSADNGIPYGNMSADNRAHYGNTPANSEGPYGNTSAGNGGPYGDAPANGGNSYGNMPYGGAPNSGNPYGSMPNNGSPYREPYDNTNPYNSPYHNGNPYYNGNPYGSVNATMIFPQKRKGEGMAAAAMVLGIISLISLLLLRIYVPFLLGGVGIILAVLSKGSAKKMLGKAKAGLICCITGLVLDLILCVSSVYLVFALPDIMPELVDEVNKVCEEQYGISYEEIMDEIYEMWDIER